MIVTSMLLQLMQRANHFQRSLLMTLLLSQHKMIDWLIESISKHKSLKIKVKESKQQEIGRENKYDYIRKNERIHYIDDY